jgi:hypothetical protein
MKWKLKKKVQRINGTKSWSFRRHNRSCPGRVLVQVGGGGGGKRVYESEYGTNTVHAYM